MTGRRIEYTPLDDVVPAIRNPKGHAAEEIGRSIAHFGLAELPLVDERTGRLVAGHGRVNRLTAMRNSGQEPPEGVAVDPATGAWLVPVIRGWGSRSDEDAEAYLITSNSLTTLGGWDQAELATLLRDLQEADPDLLAVTGYNDGDLEKLLKSTAPPDAPDEFPEYDDETIPTEHTCPACGYQWSGGKTSAAET